MDAFGGVRYSALKLETVRYMAPEQFLGECIPLGFIGSPSKESDVYSLAITSFEVCPSFAIHPTTRNDHSRYDQVLTGVLPYDDADDQYAIAARVRRGERPSRPTDPSQNQWLQDPVWDVISTGWRQKPKQRCSLSALHHQLSTSSQRGRRDTKLSDLNTQNDGNLAILKGPRYRSGGTPACKDPPADRRFLPVSAGFGARDSEARQRNRWGIPFHSP